MTWPDGRAESTRMYIHAHTVCTVSIGGRFHPQDRSRKRLSCWSGIQQLQVLDGDPCRCFASCWHNGVAASLMLMMMRRIQGYARSVVLHRSSKVPPRCAIRGSVAGSFGGGCVEIDGIRSVTAPGRHTTPLQPCAVGNTRGNDDVYLHTTVPCLHCSIILFAFGLCLFQGRHSRHGREPVRPARGSGVPLGC